MKKLRQATTRVERGYQRRASLRSIFLVTSLVLILLLSAQLGMLGGVSSPFKQLYSVASGGVTVVSAGWAGGSAIPGDQNALFNVTVQNLYYYSSICAIRELLNLSSTDMLNNTGGTLAVSYVVKPCLSPGEAGFAVFNINVQSGAHQPIYEIPIQVVYEINNSQLQSSSVVAVPITTPSPLSILSSSWSSSSSKIGGFQGDQNDSLNLQVLNPNPFPVHELSGTLTFSGYLSGPQGSSSVDYFSTPSVIQPGQTGTLTFSVNIAPNTPVGQIPISVFLSYVDTYNAFLSQNDQWSVPVYGLAAVSISQLTQTIQVSGTSTFSILVKNAGGAPMFFPSLTLHLPSGFLVTGNFTQPPTLPTSINPGGSAVFSFNITSAGNVGLGIASGTAVVSYSDQFGTARSTTFTISMNVIGTTNLVIRSIQISQALQSVSVSGTLINFGSAPATLTQLYVFLNKTGSMTPLGNASTFVGSIQPNKLFSFKVTKIPYFAQNAPVNATLTLVFVYQNSSGLTAVMRNSTSVLLLSAASFGSLAVPSFLTLPQTIIISAGIVAVIAVTVVVSFLYLKKRRAV